jgi:hypothetical protein
MVLQERLRRKKCEQEALKKYCGLVDTAAACTFDFMLQWADFRLGIEDRLGERSPIDAGSGLHSLVLRNQRAHESRCLGWDPKGRWIWKWDGGSDYGGFSVDSHPQE